MLAELIELDGTLPKEFKTYVGGKFSVVQKLKMGGVGSPKLTYLSGNTVMDKAANMSLDTNFCSMEIYPQGLVIRLYKINKLAAIALKKIEIKELRLETCAEYPHQSLLTIITVDSDLLFTFPNLYKKSFHTFFSKKWFASVFI